MENTLKVLFLTPWYPNRYDAMLGLFARKHAEAVSRYADVCVLYLHPDKHVANFEMVEQRFGAVREFYVYYPFSTGRVLSRFSKVVNYVRAFRMGYRKLYAEWGKADICQVNVLTRCGVLAYWLKLRYKISYVIVEHWSRYLPVNFNFTGFFHRLITKIVVYHAFCVMTVSKLLRDAMQTCGLYNGNYLRINNVVDDFFYQSQHPQKRVKKRMLHVSCFMDDAKNISGLLRAVKQVADQRDDFELLIVGTGVDYEYLVQYARQIGLREDIVCFVGEQTPKEVCSWMYNSDFLVMFSNYETAGVIFSEVWACGKPLISTPVGMIPENLTPQNGKLVPIGDEGALCDAIIWMLDHFQEYNPEKIRESARKFTYDEVGKQLLQVYKAAVR